MSDRSTFTRTGTRQPREWQYPASPHVVNVDDPKELRYWMRRFSCSEEQLRSVVAEAGTSAIRVETFLGQ